MWVNKRGRLYKFGVHLKVISEVVFSVSHLIGDQRLLEMRARFLCHFLVDLDDVFITQSLTQTTLLRAELARFTPDESVSELKQQVSMDLHDGRLYCESMAAFGQEQGVGEVWCLSLSLRVNTDEG